MGSAGIDTAITSADGKAMVVLASFVMPVSVAIPGTQSACLTTLSVNMFLAQVRTFHLAGLLRGFKPLSKRSLARFAFLCV